MRKGMCENVHTQTVEVDFSKGENNNLSFQERSLG